MLCPFGNFLWKILAAVWIERKWGNTLQGFRRMAARNRPAGIRSLVYGMGKGKAVIEGLSVSAGRDRRVHLLYEAEQKRLFGRFLAVADRQRLVDPHRFMADRGDREAHFGGELMVGLALDHAPQDRQLAGR